MRKIWTKIVSMLLVTALLMTCVPGDVIRAWATEVQGALRSGDPQATSDGAQPTPEQISEYMAVRFLYAEDYTDSEGTVYPANTICEWYGLGIDIADPNDYPKLKVQIGVRDPYDYELFTPLEGGKVEVLWAYSLMNMGDTGDEGGMYWPGGTPIGMSKAHFTNKINTYYEKHPEDEHLIGLWGQLDGWTTDLTMPGPMTVGELRGQEANYYVSQYELTPHLRYTPEGSTEPIYYQYFPEPVDARLFEIINSNGLFDERYGQQYLPSAYPTRLDAIPSNYLTEEDVPYGTVEAVIGEKYTPVTFYGQMWNEADGYNDFRAFGWSADARYMWMVVENMDGEALDTDGPFVPELTQVRPVGMPKETWQRLVEGFIAEYPDEYAAGNYTALYQMLADEYMEYWPWQALGKLPFLPDRLVEEYDEDYLYYNEWEPSDDPADYTQHTYTCLMYWWMDTGYEDMEKGEWVEQYEQCFGFARPVTIVPVADDSKAELVEASPLPESDIKGLEWFRGFDLTCDAKYGKQALTYQWYRSLTPDYNGTPIDPNEEYDASEATYGADYPPPDKTNLTYYYYCEYSFVNEDGETETHRTTICALRRAPCSMLEIKVAPGAFYLEPDPGNTNYYSPEYIRYSNATLDLADPDDYTLPYAYQVYGGESVLSAWIEPEDLYESRGFIHSDYITWQWYRSETEDWTTGEKVGEEGKVEGLTEVSLRKDLVSGTMSLINFNAFNKHANIHVECPTDTLEPFYMTVVITNHYTNTKGEKVTSTSTARCKVFTFEENEDLYTVDSTGMLRGYNGHESVWNIPDEINGVKVTSIGEMAQEVKPPADSDIRHYAGPTKIVIPEGVTEICDDAFFRLYSLEEVVLPKTSLTRIGSYAFGDTGAIRTLTLPASVQELGKAAFSDSRIREFFFDKDVWPTIGSGAFMDCDSLKEIVFPANATGALDGLTFYDSNNLSTVRNWQNIQELDRDDDFKMTPAYEYLFTGSGGESDGNFIYMPDEAGTGWTVVQCVMDNVTTVQIPAYFMGKPVTTVGRGSGLGPIASSGTIQLVENVLELKHLVLPETVHTINERAFDGCEYLETVTFHKGIKLVKENAFSNCFRLTSTVTLAAGAEIRESAFQDCRSITRLDAPGAYIENYAFQYCLSLEEVSAYLPLLPEYDPYTYKGGYQYWPFAYTKTYTDSNESARYYSEPDQDKLLPPEETPYLLDRRYENIYYRLDETDPTKGTIKLYGGANDYEITLPGVIPNDTGDGYVYLTNVSTSVFEHVSTEYHDVVFEEGISVLEKYSGSTGWRHPRIRNVKLPQSLTDINNFFRGGFEGTGLLESINIPSGVIVLIEEAFANNPKLHTVTFDADSQLSVIEASAFRDANALKNLDLSKLPELTKIGKSAFNGCDLAVVDLTGSPKLKVIEESAFAYMYNLQRVRLPDNLEDIGSFAFQDGACLYGSTPTDPDEYFEIVYSLNPLKELVLPANLKKIGKCAFLGQFMDNTKNDPYLLELPENLEWIGNEAFGGYNTTIYVDMELWSNVALEDDKLPEGLKIFGNYSTEVNDKDSVAHTDGGPFARSVIEKVVFPAGIEILGQDACNYMPKLHTVVFLAEDRLVEMQPSDDQEEPTRPTDPIPEETQPESTRPTDPVPEETQPEETQPESTRPTDPIPEETQPEETQPESTRPTDPIPEETQPEETQPESTRPTDPIPEETEPEETLPPREDVEINTPTNRNPAKGVTNGQIPDGWEVVYTSALRELHPRSLASNSIYSQEYGWAQLTTIEGFENLRMLEYMEDVFDDTAASWKFPEESYTLPDTIRHLGVYALGSWTSSFQNITIPAGIAQIDREVIPSLVADVGPYITALEDGPRNTVLDKNWLWKEEDPTTMAILRCYKGSAFHMWAEENQYPYELIDPRSRVVFLDLTENGTPLPHPETWLESCVWKDSNGNVVSTEYIFRDAQEGETYTVTANLNFEKLQSYILPQKTATVTLEVGKEIAYAQLAVSYRDSVTVKGVLPQTGISRFDARIVQSNYPNALIAHVRPDVLTGEFTLQVPRVDCKLVLTADADTPYLTTEYTNLLWSKPVVDNVIDLGVLPMELGPMWVIPLADGVDLSRCSSLAVTAENGKSYYAQVVDRYLSGEDVVNDVVTHCLYIKNAIRDGVTIGDKLTLTSNVINSSCDQVVPYTFVVPQHNLSFSIKPEVKTPIRIVKKTNGYVYLFDSDGNAVHDSDSGISWLRPEPGNYTAIGINKKFDVATLQNFLDLGLPEGSYIQQTITMPAEKYGENIVIDWKLPDVTLGDWYGISMSHNAAIPDSYWNIPIYIKFNLSNLVPEGPMELTLSCESGENLFSEFGGEIIVADTPGFVQDVRLEPNAAGTSNLLHFTVTGRKGLLTLYTKPDGRNLFLKWNNPPSGKPEAVTMIVVPGRRFAVSAPPAVTENANGVMNIFFSTGGNYNYNAVVIVDGVEQTTVKLYATASAIVLPYTLKTYADGSSSHTIQVVVRDLAGKDFWASEIWNVIHTNSPVPLPQRLDITMTNYNMCDSEGNLITIDSTDPVQKTFLDYQTGKYHQIRWWEMPDQIDGNCIMLKDLVYDYSLTISHPEMIEDQIVYLEVFIRESYPYVQMVELKYNELTDTFDGSLLIPGGTICGDDAPYGVSLHYTTTTKIEETSKQFVVDQLNARDELLQSMMPGDYAQIAYLDIDALTYYFEQQGFSKKDRDILVKYLATYNEVIAELNKVNQEQLEVLQMFANVDSGKTLLENVRLHLEKEGIDCELTPLDPSLTKEELLEMHFVEFQLNQATLYILADLDGYQVVYLDTDAPENSLMLRYGQSKQKLAKKNSEQSDPTVLDVINLCRTVLGQVNAILSAADTALDHTIAFMQKIQPMLDEMSAMKNLEIDLPFGAGKIKIGDYLSINIDNIMDDFMGGSDEAYDLLVNALKNPDKLTEVSGVLKRCASDADALTKALDYGSLDAVATANAKLLQGATELKNGAGMLGKVHTKIAKVMPVVGALVSIGFLLYDAGCYVATATKYCSQYLAHKEIYNELNKQLTEKLTNIPQGYCINDMAQGICTGDLERMRKHLETMRDHVVDGYSESKGVQMLADAVATFASVALPTYFGAGISFVYGAASTGVSLVIDPGYEDSFNTMNKKIKKEEADFKNWIEAIHYKCDDSEPDDPWEPYYPPKPDDIYDPDNKTPDTVLIDPSGYVYEAVASNRVEGATAQVFYRDEAGNEVLWTAALYDQENPQITNSLGGYSWMTPPGDWLVKITKDGYLPADSKNDPAAVDGWLPVPPPQMNVNIGMISTAAPEVLLAVAAPDRIQLMFSQYMDIAYLNVNPELITVTQDGVAVPVAFTFSDSEESPTKAGVFYGRCLNITRTDGEAFYGEDVCVTIAKELRNYASTAMEAEYVSGAMEVQAVADKIVHSYANRLVANVGDAVMIRAQVLDTRGRPIAGTAVALRAAYGGTLDLDGIVTAISDENGVVSYDTTALHPGTDFLEFSTDNGVVQQMQVRVEPVSVIVPSKPTANLTDLDTVASGTELVLECATEGAIIYYTTDDTCPCTDSPNRKIYTGPVAITKDTLFRIASWTPVGGYSERLNLQILVESDGLVGDINMDGVVDFLDLGALQAFLSGKTTELSGDGDANCDGKIDFLDLGALQAYLAGKVSTLG